MRGGGGDGGGSAGGGDAGSGGGGAALSRITTANASRGPGNGSKRPVAELVAATSDDRFTPPVSSQPGYFHPED